METDKATERLNYDIEKTQLENEKVLSRHCGLVARDAV